ncbi:energy transducer TonB [Parabacteroides sp. FAFU027]|uniref:energy transducer TonB n=1 Tax=Parabacteroides sp. FAFU027 TaxID=2922715 RepID=UPI001FAF3E0D|nr:energy transducer TonB [Parabacteroides sp. FAFU027]
MKKLLFAILTTFVAIALHAQDTTYYDSNNKVVRNLAECTRYFVKSKDTANSKLFIYNCYFKSGKIYSSATMREWNLHTSFTNGYEGVYKEWYESGKLHKIVNFNKGKLDGELISYWDNGKLKRKEYYENGKMTSGKYYRRDGMSATYYPYFKKHEFPGGRDSLISFVAKNASYFQNIDSVKPNLDYYFFFVINKSGIATTLTMPYNYNKQIFDAALRLIQAMPKWQPMLTDGIFENSAMRIAYVYHPNKSFTLKFFYDEKEGIESSQQFYPNAKLYFRKEFFCAKDSTVPVGEHIRWSINGQILSDIHYKKGKLDGELTTYWYDGKLKRKDTYKEDQLVTGQCYDPWGNPTAHGPFAKKAEYLAGQSAIDSIIKKNLFYPMEARKANIKGTVYVKFTINLTGSISDVTVVKKVNPLLDEEAMRVVKYLGKWKAAIWDGEPVDSNVILPIEFKL